MHAHRKYHDDVERRQWQNPEAILAEIGLKAGMRFLDIGCGNGFFSLPASRIVGITGKVLTIDADEESIRELGEKAAKEGITNIEATAGRAEDVILCDACADIAFFGICLHDFDDPAHVLQNARHMLRRGGTLVDLDWKKEPMSFGPPLEKRFDIAKASKLITDAGFRIESTRDSGLYHYLIIAK